MSRRRQEALDYHSEGRPGKIEVIPTKPVATQGDLSLAYSPGVAEPCREIHKNPDDVFRYTARGNLVAVVSNGTAVLGLGNIGPLASKPVMEGKGVLFKRFAGIDVFDIEVDTEDPDELIRFCQLLEPTVGGINLEDIRAPDCFHVEETLKRTLEIPVFHDDQHGTAIIAGAGLLNALELVGKTTGEIRVVFSGAGASALATAEHFIRLGVPREAIYQVDSDGVIYEGRSEGMNEYKARFAQDTPCRTMADVVEGADVVVGLSVPGAITREHVASLADRPIIFALANPDPEITPEEIRVVRDDAIVATGRSDYPNQVNNVLCFPFIFRGALDVGATTINDEMKLACVEALADLTMQESSDVVVAAYGGKPLQFGPEYLIPKPFDPRLISRIAPAVARAAMDSGIATRPIEDFGAYVFKLNQFVFQSGLVMKPLFEEAREELRNVVYAEGEQEIVLRAVQVVVDDGLAKPILIGRRKVVEMRIRRLGLRLRRGEHYELCDPEDDPRYREYWTLYHSLMERRGVTPDQARNIVRTRNTVIAALMVYRGEADALICGTVGRYHRQLQYIESILGRRPGVRNLAAMNALILPKGTFFLCDTYVHQNPTVQQVAEMTILAADEVRRFGIIPKVALLSHSSFGTSDAESAVKMREALQLIEARDPSLEVEGEMHGDAALSESIRKRIFPNARLKGQANLLIMPTLDASNIAFNLLKIMGDGVSVGPILLGTNKPAHILTPSVTTRGIMNMTALAAVEAGILAGTPVEKETA
jgi:malate dehydrogenase (oxaloacetate-decarboxylating)(NADP+)